MAGLHASNAAANTGASELRSMPQAAVSAGAAKAICVDIEAIHDEREESECEHDQLQRPELRLVQHCAHINRALRPGADAALLDDHLLRVCITRTGSSAVQLLPPPTKP